MQHTRSIHAAHSCCIHVAHMLRTRSTHVAYMQHTCRIHAAHIQHTCKHACSIHAAHMQRTCNMRAMHTQHVCNACATCVPHMCNICATYVRHTSNTLPPSPYLSGRGSVDAHRPKIALTSRHCVRSVQSFPTISFLPISLGYQLTFVVQVRLWRLKLQMNCRIK